MTGATVAIRLASRLGASRAGLRAPERRAGADEEDIAHGS
jgi:hypothetical protein